MKKVKLLLFIFGLSAFFYSCSKEVPVPDAKQITKPSADKDSRPIIVITDEEDKRP